MIYQLKFWEAVANVASGVLLILFLYGQISVQWALSAGAILQAILAVLKFVGIEPELRSRLW